MVRLIRMASKNNCSFEANLDNDMIIKPNSSMAVLNATFKSPFSQITIDDDLSQVSFVGTLNSANTPPISSTICKLTEATYSGKDATLLFLKNLLNTLNGTLNCQFSTLAGEGNPNYNQKITNATFGEFFLGPFQIDNNSGEIIIPEKLTIQYAYAPLLTPFGPTAPGGLHGGNGTKNSQLWTYDPAQITPVVDENTVTLAAGVARTPLPIYHASSQLGQKLCMGTSLFIARVADYADNTASGGSPLDNGFAIGLSLGIVGTDPGTALPARDRYFEIQFLRQGLPYSYLNRSPISQTSAPVVAQRCSRATYPLLNEHDVIWFRIRGDQDPTSLTFQKHVIEAGVWQEMPGGIPTEHVFFKTELTDAENYEGLAPYMYITGNDGDVKIDATSFNLSPFQSQILSPREPIDWNKNFADGYTTPGQPDNQPNDYRILSNITIQDIGRGTLGKFLPQILYDRWSNPGLTFTSALKMSQEIWDYIGFKEDVTPEAGGFSQIAKKIGNADLDYINQLVYTGSNSFNLDADDNFIVLIDNLPVDSYDASKNNYDGLGADPLVARSGRRKNILMTIPKSEDENNGNLVQFATNTPIFIDFLNTQELNIRNLKLRILRKNFGIVETGANNSILTVLIKDGE